MVLPCDDLPCMPNIEGTFMNKCIITCLLCIIMHTLSMDLQQSKKACLKGIFERLHLAQEYIKENEPDALAELPDIAQQIDPEFEQEGLVATALLHTALQAKGTNCASYIEQLLAQGADIDSDIHCHFNSEGASVVRNYQRPTALFAAITCGNTAGFKRLVKENPQILHKKPNGFPLKGDTTYYDLLKTIILQKQEGTAGDKVTARLDELNAMRVICQSSLKKNEHKPKRSCIDSCCVC